MYSFEKRAIIYLSFYVVTLIFAMFFSVIFFPIRDTARDIANIIVGVSGASLTGIMGYYWGASKSGKDKDESINALASKVASATDLSPKHETNEPD